MEHLPQDGHNRVAIVTGASRGIGYATAEALLSSGFRVAILSHDPKSIQAAEKKLAAKFGGAKVTGQCVDLRSEAEIANFFNGVKSKWESPSVLVCNAGISPKSDTGSRVPFTEVGLDEWHDVLSVNLLSVLLCCQNALPAMAKSGYGRVILIGSIATRILPQIAGTAYVASKSGLSGLLRAIVSEYSEFGITTNLIAPGLILSEMAGTPDDDKNKLALQRIPVKKFGHPHDVARIVNFLAAKEAGFINGATIDVNGGEFISP